MGWRAASDVSLSYIPAVKTLELRVAKREDARTSMHSRFQHLTCGFSPPVGVPSRDGSFGVSALKGPASLGWSLLTLGARTFLLGTVGSPPVDPPILALGEGSCPALGPALHLPQRSGHLTPVSTLKVAHPGRGARGGLGLASSEVGCVYGSFVAILLQARGCLRGHPASGRNMRPSPFRFKTRAL